MKPGFFVLFFSFYLCSAQVKTGNTLVYKVRAPLAKCEIICKDSNFLLEKDSYVTIKVTGKNPKTEFKVTGAKILSENDGVYKIRMFQTGSVILTVFQDLHGKSIVIGTKKMEVKPPLLHFCGIAMDSSSNALRLGKCHIWAYSEFYKTKLPVNNFSMLFYEDAIITKKNRKPVADTLTSDTCKLSKPMLARVRNFQPHYNRILIYNVYCQLPDGSRRLLEPFELFGILDTVANSNRAIFTIRKKT